VYIAIYIYIYIAHVSCYLLYLRASTPSKRHTQFHGISTLSLHNHRFCHWIAAPLVYNRRKYSRNSSRPHMAQHSQRDPQGRPMGPKSPPKKPKEGQSRAKGSQRDKIEFIKTYSMNNTQWWFSQSELNRLYVNLKRRKPTLNMFLVTFSKQH